MPRICGANRVLALTLLISVKNVAGSSSSLDTTTIGITSLPTNQLQQGNDGTTTVPSQTTILLSHITTVFSLTTTVSSLTTTVSSLTTTVSSLTTTVSSLTTTVSSLTTTVSSLTATVSLLTTTVSSQTATMLSQITTILSQTATNSIKISKVDSSSVSTTKTIQSSVKSGRSSVALKTKSNRPNFKSRRTTNKALTTRSIPREKKETSALKSIDFTKSKISEDSSMDVTIIYIDDQKSKRQDLEDRVHEEQLEKEQMSKKASVLKLIGIIAPVVGVCLCLFIICIISIKKLKRREDKTSEEQHTDEEVEDV